MEEILSQLPMLAQGPVASGAIQAERLVRGAVREAGSPAAVIPAVGGNALRELVDMGQGLSQLAAGVPYGLTLAARAAVHSPLDTTLEQELTTAGHAVKAAGPAVVNDLKQEAVDLATDPGSRLVRKPLTTSLDVAGAAALPGQLARGGTRLAARAAQAAGRAGVLAPEIGANLGRASAAVDAATEALSAPAIAKRASDELEKAIPAYAQFAEDRRQVGAVRKVIADSTREFYRRRSAELTALDQTLSPLTKAERGRFADVVMGLEPMTEDASPAMHNAVEYWRTLSAQEQANLVAIGRLSENAATLRRFQPQRLMGADDLEYQQAIERAAKTPGVSEFMGPGTATATKDGEAVAVKLRRPVRMTQEGAQKLIESQTYDLLEPIAKAKGIQVLSEDGSRRAVESLTQELEGAGEKLPVYFPFLKAEEKAPWDFLPQRPTQRPKPGFLRSSVGRLLATGQLEKDPAFALARHRAQVVRFEQAEKEVDRVLALPTVRKIASAKELAPNEMLFAPSGMLKFYRGQVKFTGQFFDELAKAGDIEEALVGTIRSFLHDPEHAKTFLGVMKSDDLYAVPRAVGRELRARFAPTPPWIRTLFDRPIDYWRYAVLALRPAWLVNNVVGNLLFSVLAGTSPTAYLKALSKRYIAAMPDELSDTGMSQEFRVLQLGGSESTRLGQAIQALERSAPAKAISWLPRKISEFTLKANTVTDDYFRRATFISKAEKLYGAQRVKAAGAEMIKATDFASRLDALGPDGVQKALDHANRFFNDFSRSSPFERRVLRRIFPFVAFQRHVLQLALRLPVEFPGRAALLERAAFFAKEAQEDRFEQLGVDPTQLAPYRKTNLPIARTEDGGVRVWSTGGFNPFSGLGLNSADMSLEPSGAALVQNAAQSMNPIFQGGYEWAFGRDLGTGQPFSAPGVVEVDGRFYAEDPSDPRGFREVSAPRPGLGHMVGSSIPQVQLYRSFHEPYRTFDLPDEGGYQPMPVRGELAPPSVSPFERAAAYLGAPVRTLRPEQLATRPVDPKTAAKIRREFARRHSVADQAKNERKER